ncbi:TrkH family potassium uptake protein [Bacteroides acidifaciens]|uniref:TrkH family potassium uptake protein n=2 Tax=Bacteroides acidifaciens TaxID=85831 RepID=UPI0025884A7B|nr:TrkH family potassium uptake protein [Bacteroides acidifaciens]
MKTKIFGLLILMESLFMLLTCGVSYYYKITEGDDDLTAFSITTAVTFMAGFLLYMRGRRCPKTFFSRKDNFLMVSMVWIVFSFFGMFPFLIYGTVDNVASAYFEAMSGFTTTGASVLNNIDEQPHGILFWRSLTQWLGGLGIVVFSFALIPVYELKNANMFSAEVTGLSLDKLRPKIGDTARRLLSIYILLTVVCFVAYWLGNMDVYDSVCYSMSTIATGGFGTHQASMAFFSSPYLEYVCSFFMIVSSINFSLFYYFSIGRSNVFFKNEELKWFLCIVGVMVLLFIGLFYNTSYGMSRAGGVEANYPSGMEEIFRTALFHVSTIISTSGFQASHYDYIAWGAPFWMPTLILMIIGSCAGSTSGGVKVIRILVCIKDAINEFKLQLHPRAVISVRLSGNVLPDNKVIRALAFLFLYFMLVIIGVIFLTLTGLDMDTAFGSSITALSNVGPGMGTTGPSANFAEVSYMGKWLLSFLMLVGRLEIFTVLFLFLPDFWKQKV